MRVELRRVELPEFGVPHEPPEIRPAEYERRVAALHEAVGADWIGVYGDREHAANLLFLTGFDPRFEEALLLLGPAEQRALVVGNEGLGHAVEARLPVEVVLCQSFSLMGQPRDRAPRLEDVLRAVGIRGGEAVGVVGWKYLEPAETSDTTRAAFVPAMLVDALASIGATVSDATPALMHPETGLRASNGADQLAVFEWAAARVSATVLRVVRGARPGMSELEAAGQMGYAGEPLSCHPIVASGDGPINGLRSPTARRLRAGDGIACGIGYWGALSCRAGLLTAEPDTAFFESYVAPYYSALAAWYGTVRIGATGGEVYEAVLGALEGSPFRPLLNPGHLISYDEWVHSPIAAGSELTLRSGMALQCDVIPAPLPPGKALNCEDGIALADQELRDELARAYPAAWARIGARRAFMERSLGVALAPEVLPLSSAPGYLPPFWLAPERVCVAVG